MRVQPKVLVQRLSPVCTGMLEAAVGRAAQGRYYEIVPEHMLHGIIGQEDGDAAEILKHFDQDRARLIGRIERTLKGMKTGNAGRPVFAESLFQWIEDAWTLASLLYGVTRLRTGHLLDQLGDHPLQMDVFGKHVGALRQLAQPHVRDVSGHGRLRAGIAFLLQVIDQVPLCPDTLPAHDPADGLLSLHTLSHTRSPLQKA